MTPFDLNTTSKSWLHWNCYCYPRLSPLLQHSSLSLWIWDYSMIQSKRRIFTAADTWIDFRSKDLIVEQLLLLKLHLLKFGQTLVSNFIFVQAQAKEFTQQSPRCYERRVLKNNLLKSCILKSNNIFRRKFVNMLSMLIKEEKKVIFTHEDWVWPYLRKDKFPSQRKYKLQLRSDRPFKVPSKINNNAWFRSTTWLYS